MSVVLFGIAAGYLANRLKIMGGETDKKITSLILTITLPAMTVGAVASSEDLPDTATVLSILLVAAVFYGLSFLVAAIVPRLLGGTAVQLGVWRFSLCFANVGFIGIPVAVAFFGDEAMIYAVILMLPFNLLSYALGPLMLTGGMRDFSWKQMLTPCVAASALALTMTLLRLRPPALVGQCLDLVGDATVPLSLMIIGSMLAGQSFRQVFASGRLWGLSLVRLVILPVLLWVVLRALQLTGMAMSVAVLQMAMPVAANGTMLALAYGGDVKTMAQGTFLSTLLSMLTVPLIATLLL